MLTTYLNQVSALLQNPSAPTPLYSAASLTSAINQARGQIAADGLCIRRMGAVQTASATQVYPFSAITGLGSDVTGAINVRSMWYTLGGGLRYIGAKSFEWVSLYYLNTALNTLGPPKVWAQYGQGVADSSTVGGSFYLGPAPDAAYALQLDTACQPIPLAIDATPEAIPSYWTDCVQFLAAFYALLGAQSTARQADAARMFATYEEYAQRARRFANPEVLQGVYSQSPDILAANRLGVQPRAAQGGG